MTRPPLASTDRSHPNPDPSPDRHSQTQAPIVISQRHLSLFDHCPRHYQAEILEQRSLPISEHQRYALQRGQHFHHLLQQRALGVVSAIHDPQLDRWLDRLHHAAMLQPHGDSRVYQLAEHTRTLSMPPFTLLVRYDALIADRDRADIIDWKTYARPKQPQKLANHWQTRLYRYVLAATSEYPPDRITMVYWFAESEADARGGSDRVTFPYDADQFQRDDHEIRQLLDRLATYRLSPQVGPRPPFPNRLELGQPCDRDRCACLRLQLLSDRELGQPAIEIDDIDEVVP
jgi:PD-(D/E)XK nuclease superfamily